MCAMLAESDMWNSMIRATIPAIVAIVFVVCRRWFPRTLSFNDGQR
jgi:hypothetical protein